jgi:glycine reductase
MRVVYYMNQFFAGIGGEDKAYEPPTEFEGPVGPARLFEKKLGGKGIVVKTVSCGDNYFAENAEKVKGELLERIRSASPDVFVAGPAFGSGRHGIACATITSTVAKELKIPAVTAMHPENPGIDVMSMPAYVLPTEIMATTMDNVLTRISKFVLKLVEGQAIGDSKVEGYISLGRRVNIIDPLTGADRLFPLLWAKLKAEDFTTEVPLPKYEVIPPPPAINEIAKATIALVTESGVVPKGNPDGLVSWSEERWFKYPISHLDDFTSTTHQTVHGGYENTNVNQDPDRAVPLDVVRALEKEGRIGKVADFLLTTSGNVCTTDSAKRMGCEMAEYLRRERVDGVILTST